MMNKKEILEVLKNVKVIEKKADSHELNTHELIDEAMFELQYIYCHVLCIDEIFYHNQSEIVDSRCYGDDESAAEGLGVDIDELVDGFYIEDCFNGGFLLIDEEMVGYIADRMKIDLLNRLDEILSKELQSLKDDFDTNKITINEAVEKLIEIADNKGIKIEEIVESDFVEAYVSDCVHDDNLQVLLTVLSDVESTHEDYYFLDCYGKISNIKREDVEEYIELLFKEIK